MNEEEESKEVLQLVPFEPRRIFVCFDGSDNSKRALNAAISMASRYSAMVIATHAVPLPLNGYGLGEPYYDWELFEKSARNRIQKLLNPYLKAAEKLGVNIRANFLGGTISIIESLLESSERESADIIVMGSRGLGGFRGLLIGSVSQGIASHSKVPVMIIK